MMLIMFTNKQVHMQTETVNIPFPPSEHDHAVTVVICSRLVLKIFACSSALLASCAQDQSFNLAAALDAASISSCAPGGFWTAPAFGVLSSQIELSTDLSTCSSSQPDHKGATTAHPGRYYIRIDHHDGSLDHVTTLLEATGCSGDLERHHRRAEWTRNSCYD
jgi:hypothetical protein